MIGFFLAFVPGPLTVFTPQLARSRRKGLADYGLLATRYVEGFEQKWLGGNSTESEELLGSADIQSMADLGNSYAAVREMKAVPFDLQDITRLAAATAVPLLPLGLIVFSLINATFSWAHALKHSVPTCRGPYNAESEIVGGIRCLLANCAN